MTASSFQDKYLSLLHHIDQGFCIIEMIFDERDRAIDYLFLEVNRAFEMQTGLENPVGKTMRALKPGDEDQWFQIYGKVALSGEPVHFEMEASQPAGGAWYEVSAFRIGPAKAHQVAILFTDITLRKNRERELVLVEKISRELSRLRDVEDSMSVIGEYIATHFGAAWCVFAEASPDLQHAIATGWNTAGHASLTGVHLMKNYLSPDQLVSHNAGTIAVVNNVAMDERVNATTYSALGIHSFILIPLARNGHWRFLLSVLDDKPRNWSAAEIDLLQLTAERIWARVELARGEEAIRSSEMELRQALRLREEFIAIASHELKTPVTSIRLYAGIVRQRLENARNVAEHALIERLNKQLDRLVRLIDSLLDITKISEGQLKLQPESFDLCTLLEERIEEIKPGANHPVSFTIRSEMPAIYADRERIGQVIINLLSNAIKYSPPGSPVSVECCSTAEGVRVSIADEGVGIPMEDREKIFERFYRVSSDRMESVPGIGLGLYISAQIIHRHKGRIWVEGEVGKGTNFVFIIPVSLK